MSGKYLKLGFVGDLCLAGAEHESEDYLKNAYALSKRLNESVDLAIANLEFNISPPNITELRRMSLPAKSAENIGSAGFDVFCMSNNHMLDFGSETLLHSKQFLEDRGMQTVGAGKNLEVASCPLFIEKNGFKLAILNVSDATLYAAKNNLCGIAPLKKPLLKKAVTEAKQKADIIIVCIHSDLEFTNSPALWRVSLCRELAELGPDMIIQHHPHTLQGIEYWQNTLIAYSLGNFIFPIHRSEYMSNRTGHVEESIYLVVDISEDVDGQRKISHDIIALTINKVGVTEIASPDNQQNIKQKVQKYSAKLKDHDFLQRTYFDLCKQNMKQTLLGIYYRIARRELGEAWNYLTLHFSTNAHTNWIRGFFTLGRF